MNETQNNFLLSPAAQALKPNVALSLKADEAYDRFKAIRFGWTDGRVVCPKCEGERHYELARAGRWCCVRCRHQFTVTSGTAFASRKMSFTQLLGAIALRVHRASPAVLARELDLNYRAAWAFNKRLLVGNLSPIRTRERMWPFISEQDRQQEGRALIDTVNASIPKTIPEQVRADVAQDIILGVLAGEITEADIRASVRKYMTRYYAGYSNQFRDFSWDAPVPGTDGMRWDEIIPTDHARR